MLSQFIISLTVELTLVLSSVAQPITLPQSLALILTPTEVTIPVKPQTDAQAADSEKYGRNASFVEPLQPTLDRKLVQYERLDTSLSGNIALAASDVLAGLTRAWIDAFEQIYPQVSIHLQPPYAGSLGAKSLINGSIDGVLIARELKPSDITEYKQAMGQTPSLMPIGGGTYRQPGFIDTMAFIVHKDNPVECLNLAQLDGIFSISRLRGANATNKWRDLGVSNSLAENDVRIYGLQPWNGFEEFIRQRVLNFNGARGEWRNPQTDKLVTWDKTVFNVSQRVSKDRSGIGYTGLAYIDSPVKVLGIRDERSQRCTPPTYENIALARYPLARTFYFASHDAKGKTQDPVLREIQKFIVSQEGQRILLRQAVFLPLRKSQQEQSLEMLE